MSTVRVEANKATTLEQSFYVDGALTSSSTAVTVTITKADGTALVTGAATTNPSTGVYRYALAPQATLNHLTVVWSGTWGGTAQTEASRVEVVGDRYVTLAQIRALPNLSDPAKFTNAEIATAIDWFEQTFEDYTGVAWVRRFARVTLNGTGSASLILPHMYPRVVRSVRTYTAAATYTAYTTAELDGITLDDAGVLRQWSGTFARGSRNIVVEYEHGYNAPPADVMEAAKVAVRAHLLDDYQANRQFAVSTEAGIVRTSQPGEGRPFGLPDVDACANRRSERIPAVA